MTKLPIKTEDTPPWAASLTIRERLFVEQYVIDLNGKAAVLRAFGKSVSAKSAAEMASRLKRKPEVAKAISVLVTERSGVTGAAVLGELGAIAFSRITDYLKIQDGRLVLAVSDLNELSDEAKGAIAKLRERVSSDGTVTIEVELHDKIAALDRLGKASGILKDRVEVSRPDEDGDTGEDVAERIMARWAQLRKNLQAYDAANAEIQPPLQRIAPPQCAPAAPIIDAE